MHAAPPATTRPVTMPSRERRRPSLVPRIARLVEWMEDQGRAMTVLNFTAIGGAPLGRYHVIPKAMILFLTLS